MKRLIAAGILAAMLCMTGCSNDTAQSSENSAESSAQSDTSTEKGLQVDAAEDVDSAYIDTLKTYFTAIEQKDYEAFKKTMYPPYLEAYSEYLKEQGSSSEESFKNLCSRFDEDGYESWTLTNLQISYYPEEKVNIDDFFQAFIDAGIFDDKLAEDCKKNAEEIRDVQFSLQALYAGDEAPVTVVSGNEIMMVKTADGTYLFG